MYNITEDTLKQLRKRTTLIIGRTASGKSTLERYLVENFGLKPVLSYTNRPKRSEDDNTHTFVTNEEMDAVVKSNTIIAKTMINGFTYFATQEQLREADLYVIDPAGLYDLFKNTDDDYNLIYLKPEKEVYAKFIDKRIDETTDTDDLMARRILAESAQFDAFENLLENGLHERITLLNVTRAD